MQTIKEHDFNWLQDPKVYGVNRKEAHSDHHYFGNYD
ncbi:MAG: hypothetical protein K0R69_1352, partial [Clostridia bacterium]|nr:hypothetical protein [Clostridia bacterium]